jgi:prepilin-type N-terminal cleavage/methylation domain-containing protein
MRRRQGFTLLELMIVVVIIGVLSAVAIPSFRSYLHRSRTTEAFTFLAEIRQRQEAYRAEFGEYCAVSGGSVGGTAWAPAAAPGAGAVSWTGAPGFWNQLGAAPDGLVRFQYQVVAGPPATAPTTLGFDGSDFWFVAQARGDLDGDGEFMLLETYSAAGHVFVGTPSGAPLPGGWE